MAEAMHSLLLIEDDPLDALLFEELVHEYAPETFTIVHHERVEALNENGVQQHFDAVMLDMNLPGLSGIEAVKYMQHRDRLAPIIILSGANDETTAQEAVSLGVQDYLVKGVYNGELICRSIRYSIQRKKYEEKISYLLYYDTLTGLMNADYFTATLQKKIERTDENSEKLACFYIDLNNFKDINKIYGHDCGNALLMEVGGRLKALLQPSDLIARLGNDEYVIVSSCDASLSACADFAKQINHTLEEPFYIGDNAIDTSASMGIAIYPECGKCAGDLIKNAELALHQSKASIAKHHHYFTSEMNEQVMRRIQVTSALRSAINEQQFTLHYHPKVDLASNQVMGVEALIRWHHDTLGAISPVDFIPLAEQSGAIKDITRWVLNTACEDYAQPHMRGLNVAVNISAQQLHDEDIVTMVADALKRSAMPADKLVLEITETAVLNDIDTGMAVLFALKKLGVKLYIDDFGTGYSSIDYLRRFPVDALKIDRTFVKDMVENKDDSKIVRLLVDLAHNLQLKVVAEGVETPEHVTSLRNMACDQAQGFCYCKPLDVADFGLWLKQYAQQVA